VEVKIENINVTLLRIFKEKENIVQSLFEFFKNWLKRRCE